MSGMRRAGLVAAVAGTFVLGACGDSTPKATTSTSTTTTTIATTSTTAPPATSGTTTGTATTVTAAVPGTVTTVDAGSSAGSGEVEVDWQAVDGATGYRVYRSSSSDGPFSVSGDINVSTGQTTLGPGATNIWSPSSGHFQYIEVLSDGSDQRFFQVSAYNAAGEGAKSAVVCGAPTGHPQC